jgi:hypothetical protein
MQMVVKLCIHLHTTNINGMGVGALFAMPQTTRMGGMMGSVTVGN